MTNKDWYVLHQTKKFGPFARQQILEMLKTGSVMRSQKVWKEGLEKPITSYELFLESVNAKSSKPAPEKKETLKEVFEEIVESSENVESIEDDFDIPPPLPPIPSDEESLEVLSGEAENEALDQEVIEEPEEIIIHKEIADFKRLTGQEVAVLPPLPPDIIRQKNKKKNLEHMLRKGLLLIAGLCLCAVFYVFFHDIYIVHWRSAGRPQNIDIKDYKILDKAASHNPEKLAVAIMSSKDTKSMVITTNFVYDADISIELNSIDNKVLHRNPVVINAKSKLSSGQATFKDLIFEGADTIYPGYYRVKIISSNEERSLYWYDKMFKVPQKMVMEDLTTFLGHISITQFKKKLERYLRDRKRHGNKFEGDLKQKWATLDGIVNQLKVELIEMVQASSSNWKQTVSTFEKKYTKIYGSFFTEFYLNNEEVQKMLIKTNIKELDEFNDLYDELSAIAKSVGMQTVKIIERASAFNFAPNQETRANMTSAVIKDTTAFSKRISKGQTELKRLLEPGESADAAEDEDL